MSFLSTAFLLALPLVAVPVLLHLFDRRRQVVIEWGAMHLLTEAALQRTSARKLKQWLLLLVRTLAIAALVLALARPMLPGNWLTTSSRTETIFILDNSMSMMRSGNEGTLFDEAIATTRSMAQELNTGDDVRVLLASPYPVWATTGTIRVGAGADEKLADELRELRPTRGRSDLLSALFTAAQTELQPFHERRRIVLLCDGQRADWNLDDLEQWQRFREVLGDAPVPTELEIVKLDGPHEQATNLALAEVRANHTVTGVGQPLRFAGHVKNLGPRASSSGTVVWRIGDQELQKSQLPSLESHQDTEVIWQHAFDKPGIYSVTCSLDATDALAADNQAPLVVEVATQIPILIVDGNIELTEVQQDGFFVQAALGWLGGEPLEQHSIYVPTLISNEQLATTDLTQYRAVVVPNLTSLDDEAINRLQQFTSEGGGVWIALGPRTDVPRFNDLLFANGHGLAPLPIDRISDESRENTPSTELTVDPFANEHPATREFGSRQLDLGRVAVSQRFHFSAADRREDVGVLLQLSSGEPLVVENYVGRGRVIVQSIPLQMQWSDLVRSQAFVVMVRKWFDYLTEPRATQYNLDPGEPIAAYFDATELLHATLRTPHGEEIELTGQRERDGVLFRSSRTILPGDYRLVVDMIDGAHVPKFDSSDKGSGKERANTPMVNSTPGGKTIPFHVRRDPRESQLEPLQAADQKLLAAVAGLHSTKTGGMRSIRNHRDPLWPILLSVLIGLVAAELVLSGLIARERYGGEPIEETNASVAMHANWFPSVQHSVAASDIHADHDRHTTLST